MFLSCFLFEVLNSVLSWFKVQSPCKFVINKKKHFLITLLIRLVIYDLKKKRKPISPQVYKFNFTTGNLNGNLQFNKRTLKAT